MGNERTEIRKVVNRQMIDDFIHLPKLIYKGCQQYVPEMESDVRSMFDEMSTDHFLTKPQAFVAYQDGKPVGRIVGIINARANDRWDMACVRFSFIEFIDDIEVSRSLLDAVMRWGKTCGMTSILGPMGFSDFDKEGMLLEDFHLMGSMTAIYNPEYYSRHMEQLGFTKAVDWLQIRVHIPQQVPAKYARVAKYCREQMGLRVVKASEHELMEEGMAQQIFDLLNKAYKNIYGFSELTSEQADGFTRKYLSLIDKKMMPLIINDQDELVGVAVTMSSLARALQKSGGQLWPFGWYHFLKSLKWKREGSAEMLLIAVRSDYQGLGVNAMFFDDLIPIYNKYGIRWAETGPQLEDNVRELTQWKPLNPEYVKRRRCYIKQISDDISGQLFN